VFERRTASILLFGDSSWTTLPCRFAGSREGGSLRMANKIAVPAGTTALIVFFTANPLLS